MEKHLKLINEAINDYLSEITNLELKEALNYGLFPGGKRMRPLLLLLLLEDLGIDPQTGVYPAMAIELIHTYSLIHDDLPAMDNDDYRRGKLSLHKQFGESLAILAGDALLADAFRFFLKTPISESQKLKIIEIASLNSGSQGMVLGQVLDLSKASTKEDLKEIHLHKTRDLIRLALLSGGFIANLNDNELYKLEELAYYFGLAFQIKDDLEDYQVETHKITYPSIYGIERSQSFLNEYRFKALEIVRQFVREKNLYQMIVRILE